MNAGLWQIASGVVALTTCIGCSSSSTAATSIVGTWSCTGTENLSFTQPSTQAPESATVNDTMSISDDGNGTLTVLISNDPQLGDAGVTCSRDYTMSGNTATLKSGQECQISVLTMPSMTLASYEDGTLTSGGSTLTAKVDFSFWGTSIAETITTELVGTGTLATTCTKQ